MHLYFSCQQKQGLDSLHVSLTMLDPLHAETVLQSYKAAASCMQCSSCKQQSLSWDSHRHACVAYAGLLQAGLQWQLCYSQP